jgi:thiamine pyrophosphate-dependent acetolactate synthase large subunit-like protein
MAHVGDLLAKLLVQHELTQVFGQPGGQTAALYDGINRRHPAIRHVLVRLVQAVNASIPMHALVGELPRD